MASLRDRVCRDLAGNTDDQGNEPIVPPVGRPAAALVHNVHGVPEYRIDVIPHGIPSVPFASSNEKELGIEGKSVTFTFGLLSPDKGIEHVIDTELNVFLSGGH